MFPSSFILSFYKNRQIINRLKLDLLPLTPVSAACLYPFTERCEIMCGKDNDRSPFIAGTPMGRTFQRQMTGEKEQPASIAEVFNRKTISAFLPANEQMIINVLNLISILRIKYCVMQPENKIPDSFFR